MPSTRYARSAIAAMYAGFALTLVAMIVLYVDHATANVLAGHIRAGYPSYSQVRINSTVMTYLVYLSVLGALGVLSWLCTIWAASTRKSWARWVTTGLFTVGTSIALFNLLVKDTSGETGLPPLLGWVGMLPCLAGLLAVILLWRSWAGTPPARQKIPENIARTNRAATRSDGLSRAAGCSRQGRP